MHAFHMQDGWFSEHYLPAFCEKKLRKHFSARKATQVSTSTDQGTLGLRLDDDLLHGNPTISIKIVSFLGSGKDGWTNAL